MPGSCPYENEFKVIKELNVRPKTLKLLQENTGRYEHR
jgi:hypothetical protein